jgi:hypothetical protein
MIHQKKEDRRMKKSFMFVCAMAIIVIASVITFPALASAVMWDVVDNKLIGARDIIVNGEFYDVVFEDGTCPEIFNGCNNVSDFQFQTSSDAQAASQALLDQVFLDVGSGNFDTEPELTRGIDEIFPVSAILIPFDIQLPDIAIWIVNNAVDEGMDGILSTFNEIDNDTTFAPNTTWSSWSLSTSQIPEPATIILLASGLMGFGFCRRKFKGR